jgi:hypothetical protein
MSECMHSPDHRELEDNCGLGFLPLEVVHPGNADSIVHQHLDIMLDYRALEYDLIIVQELP